MPCRAKLQLGAVDLERQPAWITGAEQLFVLPWQILRRHGAELIEQLDPYGQAGPRQPVRCSHRLIELRRKDTVPLAHDAQEKVQALAKRSLQLADLQ